MRSRMTACGCLLIGATVLGGILSCPLAAEDDLDQQLLQSLEGSGKPDSPVTIVNRLLNNTASARDRLEAGHLDRQTESLQQQILDDIDALLRQTGSPPSGNPPSATAADARSDSSGTDANSSPGTTDGAQPSEALEADVAGRPRDDPNAPSRESAERTTAAAVSEGERERRIGLATSAWGHLPPKEREQMRSAFSETYLPEYDTLIRRYYEALAARRSSVAPSRTPEERDSR